MAPSNVLHRPIVVRTLRLETLAIVADRQAINRSLAAHTRDDQHVARRMVEHLLGHGRR
jgi:DNA-binding LacI/PurR family transcriptional regulator